MESESTLEVLRNRVSRFSGDATVSIKMEKRKISTS